jgi:BirA family biotin operon repressor/biotin-[acetyl-CoA-carboxylase] ligase
MSETFCNFSAEDLRRVERTTFVQRIEFHEQLDSTNDLALVLAGNDDIELPLVVLAERQMAGRGRGANSWWATTGALTFSVVVETYDEQLPQSCWPRVSLSVGLAVCEALAELVPSADLSLKWPNDVFLDGRKLCGVLVEVPNGRSDRLVIGIGINVNNSFEAAPDELKAFATSLYDSTRESQELPSVLSGVLRHLQQRLNSVREHEAELTQAWRERCLLSNSVVRLRMGDQIVEGRCLGIDEDGALMIENEDGHSRHLAGVIEHFTQ